MDEQQMRARLAAARVGRLATTSPDGAPHVVPFVFALDGDTLYTSVDTKPKRGELRRVRNLRHDPRAAVLADHYDEDWRALWWVRADGTARILDDGDEAARGRELLSAKYGPYDDDVRVETVIAIDVARVTGWSYS